MAAPAATFDSRIRALPRAAPRDPLPARILSFATFATLVVLLANSTSQWSAVRSRWPTLLFWLALILLVNLFPIGIGKMILTLDTPILLAVAVSEPPLGAALIAFIGSIDVREFRRAVSLSQAVFNRAQIGLCIFVAAHAFRLISGELHPSILGLVGMAAAVASEFVGNVALVSLHQRFLTGTPFPAVLRGMARGERILFLSVYLGYGVMGLILALLSQRVGLWTAATFVVPILVAREAIIRFSGLQRALQELQERELLVRDMCSKIVDERRDERARVAGELHDGLLQTLFEAQQLVSYLKNKRNDETKWQARLDELGNLAAVASNQLRGVIRDLKASPLGRGGLVPTLRSFMSDVRLEHAVRIQSTLPTECTLPEDVQVVIYQVAREAILNAVRHSETSMLCVDLKESDNGIELVVKDRGRGFVAADVDRTAHFGLGLMEERLRSVGGILKLDSQPGTGTSVTAFVPCSLGQSDLRIAKEPPT